MHSFRLVAALPVFAAALSLAGCSNEVDTVVGNQRLLRGPGGLGTTQVTAPVADLDTYVTDGTANYGSVLLIGRSATYEARTFLKFARYNLPDTTLPGFAAGPVLLELTQAQLPNTPTSLQVNFAMTATAPADSGLLTWPGPGVGTGLASVSFDFTGPLSMSLGSGSFTQYKQWALDPDAVPGFILYAPLPEGVAGFAANAARFRVPYTWTSGSTTVSDTINTRVLFDFYLHPPLTPPATGADTSLVLGGGYETKIALRAPVPPIGAGYSVNELRLVLSVVDSLPGVDGSTLHDASDDSRIDVTVSVQRITSSWTEGITDGSLLTTDLLPIAIVTRVAAGPGDSLSISLPPAVARGWADNPASNNGVLISLLSANVKPGLVVAARESSRPPTLHISSTSPPPGRF